MAENKVSIDVELAIADAQSRIDKLDKKFTAFGVNAGSAVGKADKAWATFAGTLAGIGVAKAIESAARAMAAFAKAIVVDGIEAAKKYEDALNNLNGALAQTGIYTASTSAEMEAFANQIEGASRFSDDAVLSASALIQTLGKLDKDGLKGATQSAADLAAALQIDLGSAATLVGKVAAGELGALSRYGIKLDDTGTSAEKAARGLQALQERFGGRAAQDLNTFSGATTQMSNAWEDFTKAIGLAITKNPVVIAAVKEFTFYFSGLEKTVEGNKSGFKDFINNGVLALVDSLVFLLRIGDGTIRFFKAIGQTVMLAADIIVSSFHASLTGIVSVIDQTWGRALRMLGVEAGFAMKQVAEGMRDEVGKSADGLLERMNKLGETFGEQGAAGQLADYVEEARERLAAHASDVENNNEKIKNSNQATADAGVKAAKEKNEWEKAFEKGKLEYSSKVLGNFATLMQTKNRELFDIGKIAALGQAAINTYQGITAALTIPPPFGFIAAASVGAAGAVQIANIAGTQPGFATGGIVPGSSLSGDSQLIRANSREAVLTLDQQTKLFNAIGEGQLGGGGGITIAIQGDLIVDSPSRVDNLIERINERVRYGNTPLFATGLA